jgi:hypothetical protein
MALSCPALPWLRLGRQAGSLDAEYTTLIGPEALKRWGHGWIPHPIPSARQWTGGFHSCTYAFGKRIRDRRVRLLI